jgi:hypothetical protein
MSAPRMPFGKHQGARLRDLPGDYLDWLLDLDDLREPLRSRLESEARSRWGSRDFAPDPPPVSGPVDGDVAARIVEAGRRALASKHHPDIGGDGATMTRINATADRLLAGLPRRRGVA